MFQPRNFRFGFVRYARVVLVLPLALLGMLLGQIGKVGTKEDTPAKFLTSFSADGDVNGNRTGCQNLRDFFQPSAAGSDITGERPTACDQVLDIVAGRADAADSAKPIAAAKIAVDSNLRVLITEPTTHTVHILNFITRKYSQIDGAKDDRLRYPYGIAVDVNNSIYVTDIKLGRIAVYNASGKFMRYMGNFKSENLFEDPQSIAIHRPTGRIYVTDTTRNFVVILDREGKIVAEIGKRGGGSGPAEFNQPTEIAVYENEVFVLDRGNFRIQVLDLDGKFRRQFRFRNAAGSNTDGMTIDSRGRLFISFLSWIEAYNLQGQFLFRFGQGGDHPGEFQAPNGISTDAEDRVYVVDAGNRRIQVFQVASQVTTKTAAAR